MTATSLRGHRIRRGYRYREDTANLTGTSGRDAQRNQIRDGCLIVLGLTPWLGTGFGTDLNAPEGISGGGSGAQTPLPQPTAPHSVDLQNR
jgi:hypothetical protein